MWAQNTLPRNELLLPLRLILLLCSLPNSRRNTESRSRLPAAKHCLLAGSSHDGLGERN